MPQPGHACNMLSVIALSFCLHVPFANAAGDETFAQVQPQARLMFPRDHGAHPRFRTEWWYITGWVEHDGKESGFQITFFRSRPGVQEDNKSQFAPKQLIFAHAAVADVSRGKLLHDQRAARQGFGLAYAREGDTSVAIDDWTLIHSDGVFHAKILADGFALNLTMSPTQPPVLQGEQGYSRKGPQPHQASYYYSLPQLAVRGDVVIDNATHTVSGRAWLDHEWSSEILPEEAQGWDWVSINLHDGGSLMAFRMRGSKDNVLWAGGSKRTAQGRMVSLSPHQVGFEPLRQWTSPRTGIAYPVAMRVRAGDDLFELEPLLDDQELDSSMSTGIIYWEGAVRAKVNGKEIGRGYLELTGYGERPEM